MITRLKQYILQLSVVGLLLPILSLAPAAVVGATGPGGGAGGGPELQDRLCSGAEELQLDGGADCGDTEGSQDDVNQFVTSIINIFSIIVGLIAVIMIVFGGFKYITAGGDSSKITSAQHTIIYAIVGLVIVALAQIIVRFVLFRSIEATE